MTTHVRVTHTSGSHMARVRIMSGGNEVRRVDLGPGESTEECLHGFQQLQVQEGAELEQRAPSEPQVPMTQADTPDTANEAQSGTEGDTPSENARHEVIEASAGVSLGAEAEVRQSSPQA